MLPQENHNGFAGVLKYSIRLDLHNHINSRADVHADELAQFISTASKNLGQNGIVGIVDFQGLVKEPKCEQSFELLKKNHSAKIIGDYAAYIPKHDLWVIRGLESETREGHILSIGLPIGEYLESSRDLPLESALLQSGARGAIRILDHPFGFEGAGPYVTKNMACLKNLVSALETHNRLAIGLPFKTALFPNYHAKQWYSRFIRNNEKFRTGEIYGSDGHTPQSAGRVYTEIQLTMLPCSNGFKNHFDEAIRKNKMATGKKETSLIDFVNHGVAVLGGYEGLKNGMGRLFKGKRPQQKNNN